MNHAEVTTAFYHDLEIIKHTTLVRLSGEYYTERKKCKINPASAYPKVYHIKTKSKNCWTIFLCKAPSVENYKTTDDSSFCCITSYHTRAGLQVLRQFKEIKGIECFWGHFFTRYNQRMGLGIQSVQKLIEHYFLNNMYIQHCISSLETGKNIGVCKEGFAFGQLMHNNTWLVNKTFVSNEVANKGRKKFAAKMVELLEQDLVMLLAAKQFDAETHKRTKVWLQDLKRA